MLYVICYKGDLSDSAVTNLKEKIPALFGQLPPIYGAVDSLEGLTPCNYSLANGCPASNPGFCFSTEKEGR